MRTFFHLLKWDLRLLHRNNLILLSAVVAAMYVGIFYLLKPLGNLHTVLVVLVFNDPVVTGFMFAGIMLLFDKNQNTLQAMRVAPFPLPWYMFSKALLLAGLSTITALIMAIAAIGPHFHYGHLAAGVFLSALFFTFCGFIFGLYARTFNHFLLYIIGFLVPMATAFLHLAGIGSAVWYMPVPSFAGLVVLQAAFGPVPVWQLVYGYAYLLVCTILSWGLMLRTLERVRLID